MGPAAVRLHESEKFSVEIIHSGKIPE
jgi:hypothetical protein